MGIFGSKRGKIKCDECSSRLRIVVTSRNNISTYAGVECMTCRKIECKTCKKKGGKLSAPCSKCGGKVTGVIK